MFCTQCGSKNDDRAKFCSACGSSVNASPSASTQAVGPDRAANHPTASYTGNVALEKSDKGERRSASFPRNRFRSAVTIVAGGVVLLGIWFGIMPNFESEFTANCTKAGLQTESWCSCVARELDGVLTQEQKTLAIKGASSPSPSAVATAIGTINPTLKAAEVCTRKEREESFAKLSPADQCKAAKAEALKASEPYRLALLRGARGQSVPGLRESEDAIRKAGDVCGIANYSLTALLEEGENGQSKLSNEESYLKLRENLLKSDWEAWTQPPINNWKAPFPEVMVCDEGDCVAFFVKRSDQNKLRRVTYGICGVLEEYTGDPEDKKKCRARNGFLVVLSDKLESKENASKFYASAKARFE